MKTDMAEPQTPDQPAPAEEKLFTLSEISQRTGISMPTLQRYKKTYQDRLPSVGAGRKQRYPEHALPVFAELRSENAGRRGRPRKNAAATGSGRSSGVAGRLEAILVQRVRDLERFRQDVEKRFGDLVKGLQKLR